MNIKQSKALRRRMISKESFLSSILKSYNISLEKESLLSAIDQEIASLSEESEMVIKELENFVLALIQLKHCTTPFLTSVWTGERFQDMKGVNSLSMLYNQLVNTNKKINQQYLVNELIKKGSQL